MILPYPSPRALLDDARRLLRERFEALHAGAPLPPVSTIREQLALSPALPMARLARIFSLSSLETELLLMLLATEVDGALLAACARAHGDPAQRWLTPGLLWKLLGLEGADGAARAPFAPRAPFQRHRLVAITTHASGYELPLHDRPLTLDERIVAYLLAQESMDAALVGLVDLAPARGGPGPEQFPPGTARQLVHLLSRWQERSTPPAILWGPRGGGRRDAARYLATALRRPLLTLDARHLTPDLLHRLRREARLRGALTHLRWEEEAGALARWWPELGRGVIVTTGLAPPPLEPPPLVIPIPAPTAAGRRAAWRAALDGQEAPAEMDTLASQFALTPGQIRAAVDAATQVAALRGGPGAPPSGEELLESARAQASPTLLTLATRQVPVYDWEDLVLPPARLAQLHAIEQHARHAARVYDEWGFGRKLPYGRTVTALFSGPSGTGKTMAAGILARSLGLELFTIDLSSVVSKYIGETEKNLDRLFDEAASGSALLFFDEADALFGKRSEIKDAHDRYANIEVSFLLQRMERYEGIAILATNFSQNLDEAFTRRIQFMVPFPLPDSTERERIWRGLFPEQAPLAPDVDFPFLAKNFELTGGNIRNCALAAAFDAAANDESIENSHLVRAVARELVKLGRPLQRAAFGDFYALARQG